MVASIVIRVWVTIGRVGWVRRLILVSGWIVSAIIKTIVVVVLQFRMGWRVDVVIRAEVPVQIIIVGVGAIGARCILERSRSDSPNISVSVIRMVIGRMMNGRFMVSVVSLGNFRVGWVNTKVDGLWVLPRIIMAIVVLIWGDLCWKNSIFLLILFFFDTIVMSSYVGFVIFNFRGIIVVRRNDVMGAIIAVIAGLSVPSFLVSVRLLLRMVDWGSCFLCLLLWLLVFTCFLRLSFFLFYRLLLLCFLLFLSWLCRLLLTLLALLHGKVL